ncbi:MAG: hypothetical protein K2Q22_05685 [Cytophagales bacterium]|nr:hypothetical protein [Cytophagales bacterium]
MKDFNLSTNLFKKIFSFLFFYLSSSILIFGQYAQMGSKLVGTGAIPGPFLFQGMSVANSSDGTLIVCGAPSDNSGQGAVWTYSFTGSNWIQVGNKLVGAGAVNTTYNTNFGSVSLSSSGKILAVGGPGDNSFVGATWVYTLSGGNWVQMGNKIVGTGAKFNAHQGSSVKLSPDGSLLAIGGSSDNSQIGAVWIFTLSGGNWLQMGSKRVGIDQDGRSKMSQGSSLSISNSNDLLAVGANEGSVYFFSRSGSNWNQVYNPINISSINIQSSPTVELSSDGKKIIIGARDDANSLGAVWTYILSGNNWIQLGNKLIPSGTANISYTYFGQAISLSKDGNLLAVSGNSDSASVGAVWLYTLSGTNWYQIQKKLVPNDGVNQSNFGWSIGLSSNGKLLSIGGPNDKNGHGAIWVFTAPGWNSDTVSSGGGTTEPITSDTLSISGTVHQGSGLLTDGIVMAIEKTTNKSKILRVTSGNFTLDSLARGEYILYAVPNPVTVPHYLPTFYVNKVGYRMR